MIEAALERAIAYDPVSEGLEIDGAGHRALFSVGCLLTGQSVEAIRFLLAEILTLTKTLPMGCDGQEFMSQLRARSANAQLPYAARAWLDSN